MVRLWDQSHGMLSGPKSRYALLSLNHSRFGEPASWKSVEPE